MQVGDKGITQFGGKHEIRKFQVFRQIQHKVANISKISDITE